MLETQKQAEEQAEELARGYSYPFGGSKDFDKQVLMIIPHRNETRMKSWEEYGLNDVLIRNNALLRVAELDDWNSHITFEEAEEDVNRTLGQALIYRIPFLVYPPLFIASFCDRKNFREWVEGTYSAIKQDSASVILYDQLSLPYPDKRFSNLYRFLSRIRKDRPETPIVVNSFGDDKTWSEASRELSKIKVELTRVRTQELANSLDRLLQK